jgi:hypothetical protein
MMSAIETADAGDSGEHRQIKVRRRHDSFADELRADQPGKADAENRQRQSGCHLIDGETKRQNAEYCRQTRSGKHAAERPDQSRARKIRAGETACGADDHHALDAEIEHARAFHHELARRREQ